MPALPRCLRIVVPVAALGALVTVSEAYPIVINFDLYPAGTPIDFHYASGGVRFSTNGGGPCTIVADPAGATSDPNILVGADEFSDIFGLIVNTKLNTPQPLRSGCISLKVIGAGHSVVEVRTRGTSNQVLESFTVTHPQGPVDGPGNVDFVQFTVTPIASFELVFARIDPGDGVGIDDLVIDAEGNCAVPARGATWGAVKNVYR